jgi:hypothetical protein
VTVTQPAAVVPRDRWGRPRVRDLTTGKLVAYRRCTTFIDVLEDKFALDLWKQRMVTVGLASRPDLLMKAAAAAGDKTQLNEVVEAAREAGGATQAATTGSALHALTEQDDRGQEPLIPPTAQPDVDAYRALLKRERLSVAEVEVFVVYDPYKIGGTFDRIVEFDGHRYVADIKTGTIEWSASKIAMQLAVYANSQRYDPATGARSTLNVDTTRGLVIHLPAGAGEATLHWADLAIGWTGVQLAKDVWDWRGLSGLLEAPAPGEADLFAAIDAAPDRVTLEALWAFNEQTWTDLHTRAAKARMAILAATQTPSPAPAA